MQHVCESFAEMSDLSRLSYRIQKPYQRLAPRGLLQLLDGHVHRPSVVGLHIQRVAQLL